MRKREDRGQETGNKKIEVRIENLFHFADSMVCIVINSLSLQQYIHSASHTMTVFFRHSCEGRNPDKALDRFKSGMTEKRRKDRMKFHTRGQESGGRGQESARPLAGLTGSRFRVQG